MKTYNTLHIFGYGECQVITDTENKKVASDELTGVQAVVDMIYSHKPDGNSATLNYRTINIFNDMFVDYSDEEGNVFRVDYADVNAALIEVLVLEIKEA